MVIEVGKLSYSSMVNNFLVSNFSLFSQRLRKKHKIRSQILRGQSLISLKHFLKRESQTFKKIVKRKII
jgi:hypothetical protein